MIKRLPFYRTFWLLTFLLFGAGGSFAQCPEEVVITASSQEICVGEEVLFSTEITEEGVFTYQWQLNGEDIPRANEPTFSSGDLIDGDEIGLVVSLGIEQACTIYSNLLPITVNPLMMGWATIQADNTKICPGDSVIFTIDKSVNLPGETAFQWKRIRAGDTTGVGSTNIYKGEDLEDGDVIQLWVDPSVPCMEPFLTDPITINLKGGPPAQPEEITLAAGDLNEEGKLCPGSVVRFSIAAAGDGTSYRWTLPSGWSGPDTGTSIEVEVGPVQGSVVIEVTANNDCGRGPVRTLELEVGLGKPSTPGAIALGGVLNCQTNTLSFSVPLDEPSLTYTWAVPSDWELVSGQGSAAITVTAENFGLNETLTVFSTNACSDSEISSFEFDDDHPVPDFSTGNGGPAYTALAELAQGQNVSCGTNSVKLDGKIFSTIDNTAITDFENGDELTAYWSVVGLEREISDRFFSDPLDPQAIFTAPSSDKPYELKWTLIAGADSLCGPSVDNIAVEFKDCTGLDFDGVDDYVDLGFKYNKQYSIEAWIRPFDRSPASASTGTVISGPGFEISMFDLAAYISTNDRWYHIAVSQGGQLFIDGILVEDSNLSGSGGDRTLIGARWNSEEGKAENFFSGWIEEVRIWKGEISQEQIRFLMNQRLRNDSFIGEIIPMTAPGLSYEDLEGYYRLIAAEIREDGFTADLSLIPAPGKLHNMESLQENTAPLPYTTSAAGDWTEEGTEEKPGPWTHWDVWDIPNSEGWEGIPIEWNIVQTFDDLTSQDKDITVLGLLSEDGTLEMANPTVTVPHWKNSGQMLRVTHYLKLNGIIDLTGESQLLQDTGSSIDPLSTGSIEKDQQGTASSYNYNYWSSPVAENFGSPTYSIKAVMKDGTATTYQNLDFGYAYHYADGAPSNPRKVSSYWLYKFHGTAYVYGQWYYVGPEGRLNIGEGFSMKGTSGTSESEDRQNYTFKGMPNNGEIVLEEMGENQNYLIGNPYPSALDADEFILDNLRDVRKEGQLGRNDQNTFNGTLYFLSHYAEQSHYLQDYEGGYATYTLSGGIQAGATEADITANAEQGASRPTRYIPVGQAFFVNTAGGSYGGKILFKNSQRSYVKKAPESLFHQQESKEKFTKTKQDLRQKIWIQFLSPTGYSRQLLVTADENTSNDYDLGYDAPLIENNAEDMYWVFNNSKFVIQGVPHLNEDQELPIGMKTEREGWIRISVDRLLNIPERMGIYLEDAQTDEVHNLRTAPYVVHTLGGIDDERFKIVFIDKKAQAEDPVPPTEDISIVYTSSSEEFFIRNPLLKQMYTAVLTNSVGQSVQEFHHIPHEAEVRLPVKKFSPGVYIVKLKTEDGIVTEKILMEE